VGIEIVANLDAVHRGGRPAPAPDPPRLPSGCAPAPWKGSDRPCDRDQIGPLNVGVGQEGGQNPLAPRDPGDPHADGPGAPQVPPVGGDHGRLGRLGPENREPVAVHARVGLEDVDLVGADDALEAVAQAGRPQPALGPVGGAVREHGQPPAGTGQEVEGGRGVGIGRHRGRGLRHALDGRAAQGGVTPRGGGGEELGQGAVLADVVQGHRGEEGLVQHVVPDGGDVEEGAVQIEHDPGHGPPLWQH
jgi:hypothetical protein